MKGKKWVSICRLRKKTSPDFSPTKFFAGRGAGHGGITLIFLFWRSVVHDALTCRAVEHHITSEQHVESLGWNGHKATLANTCYDIDYCQTVSALSKCIVFAQGILFDFLRLSVAFGVLCLLALVNF